MQVRATRRRVAQQKHRKYCANVGPPAAEQIDTITVSSKRAIGVFDSGSGGMVTAAWLLKRLGDAGLGGVAVFFWRHRQSALWHLDESAGRQSE